MDFLTTVNWILRPFGGLPTTSPKIQLGLCFVLFSEAELYSAKAHPVFRKNYLDLEAYVHLECIQFQHGGRHLKATK